MSSVKKLVITAVCMALCIVLPLAVHGIPDAGNVILPMHFPVLLCGLGCGWPYGTLCGAVGPLLSTLVTGMPPAAVVPGMMVECAVYGMVSGLLMSKVRTGKMTADLYLSMLPAMILGRVALGFAKAWIFTPGISPFAWVGSSLITGIPGIVIQLVLMPVLIAALTRAKLLPRRP